MLFSKKFQQVLALFPSGRTSHFWVAAVFDMLGNARCSICRISFDVIKNNIRLSTLHIVVSEAEQVCVVGAWDS